MRVGSLGSPELGLPLVVSEHKRSLCFISQAVGAGGGRGAAETVLRDGVEQHGALVRMEMPIHDWHVEIATRRAGDGVVAERDEVVTTRLLWRRRRRCWIHLNDGGAVVGGLDVCLNEVVEMMLCVLGGMMVVRKSEGGGKRRGVI